MLSHPCQQTAIVSRQIRGALVGAIGPMVGILQDFAVFEPCPCIFRSDGKQRFDRLFGIIEQQVRGVELSGTVLPRLLPAADFRPPRAVPVRRPSLAPSALPDIEPPVVNRRRAQAGERRGVATRSSIFAIGPRVPPTAPTTCCRPRLEGPPPTTR